MLSWFKISFICVYVYVLGSFYNRRFLYDIFKRDFVSFIPSYVPPLPRLPYTNLWDKITTDLSRYLHWCNSVANALRGTNHILIGCISCSTRWNPYQGPSLLILTVIRQVLGPRGLSSMTLLIAYIIKTTLTISLYIHKLLHLSSLFTETSSHSSDY